MYHQAGTNPTVAAIIQAYINTSIVNGFQINNPNGTNDSLITNYLTDLFNKPQGDNSTTTFYMLHSQLLNKL